MQQQLHQGFQGKVFEAPVRWQTMKIILGRLASSADQMGFQLQLASPRKHKRPALPGQGLRPIGFQIQQQTKQQGLVTMGQA